MKLKLAIFTLITCAISSAWALSGNLSCGGNYVCYTTSWFHTSCNSQWDADNKKCISNNDTCCDSWDGETIQPN
jgi:hypothetical protein